MKKSNGRWLWKAGIASCALFFGVASLRAAPMPPVSGVGMMWRTPGWGGRDMRWNHRNLHAARRGMLNELYGGYGMQAYMYGSYGMYGGYGMPAYMSSGYGQGYYGGSGSNNSNMKAFNYPSFADGYRSATPASSSTNLPAEPDWRSFVAALGVPSEDGRLKWPLGLQILRPESQTQALRQQIDALLQEAAGEAVSGHGDQRKIDEIRQATDKLYALLRTNGKDRFFPSTYRESERFLNQLESGLKTLQQ